MKKTMLTYDENQVITLRNPDTGNVIHAVAVLDGTYWAWGDDSDDCVRGSNDYMMLLLDEGYVFQTK